MKSSQSKIVEHVAKLASIQNKLNRARFLIGRSEKAASNLRKRGCHQYMPFQGKRHLRWYKCYTKAEQMIKHWREFSQNLQNELNCNLSILYNIKTN